MKKATIILMCITLFFLCACSYSVPGEMELGGAATFYDIEYKIPSFYIFDSTQSSENFIVYESGWYKKLLLMSRSDVTEDPARVHLEKYAANMDELGAEYCEFTEFNGAEAVLAKYTKDDTNCIEVYFIHGNSRYAIALRGETEENFDIFINSVTLKPLSNLT